MSANPPVGAQDEIQVLAQEFAPDGELSAKDSLVVFDFDEQVVISKNGRTSFSEMGIRAQETTAEAQDDDYRRVATKFGTSSKPFTKIRAIVQLPEADEVEWLNDSAQDAVFNYFGLLTRDGVKVDFGLQSTIVDGVPAGSWYPFINFFPGGGQERQFQAWPEDVIAPGTELTMEMEAVPDAKPQSPGETPGLILRVLSFDGSLVVIARGGNVSGVKLDGVDQAFRRVTSLVTISRNEDAKMCGTVWRDTLVGKSEPLERLLPSLAALEPDGNLELVQSTKGTVVKDDEPYYAETVDLRCGKVVGLVIDTTGSMGGELAAVRLALTNFIDGPLGEFISQWNLTTFKDSSVSSGVTKLKDIIKSWVSGLRASGGGDCPEDSLGGISLAAETIKDAGDSRSLILVTDASPRTSNPAEVTARLKELDITLHVLLTGDCVASTSSASSSVRAQQILSARDVFSKMAEDTGGRYVYMPGGTTAEFTAVLEEFFEEASTGGPDKIPPEISVSVAEQSIWPPNHKMVEVKYELDVSDNQDPNPITEVVGVAVNEPDDIQGSGNTGPDFEITSDGRVFVRAERSGTGKKRVYTVTFKAQDQAGNKSFASVDITVPHDKGKK